MLKPADSLRQFWFSAFVLPWIVIAVYVVCLLLIDERYLAWFHAEKGPVELVSALLFVPMAYFAGRVAVALWRGGDSALQQVGAAPGPIWPAVTWFALFCLGSILMFLEETSFGQHVIGFESPEFFLEHNKQQETSLHNLAGDAPSSTLRQIANVGLPIFAIVLPIIAMKLRERKIKSPQSRDLLPGWVWVIMPGWELALWVVLAMLVSPVRKLGGFSDDDAGHWRGSLSEFKELLWYFGLTVHAWASYWRYVRTGGTAAVDEQPANEQPSPEQPAA